jgi:hypothetical protein
MPKICIPIKVQDVLAKIASTGAMHARREVAKVVATLKVFQEDMLRSDFNISGHDESILRPSLELSNGNCLWRLHPIHIHCIGLVIMREEDLHVLAICNKTELTKAEANLSIS